MPLSEGLPPLPSRTQYPHTLSHTDTPPISPLACMRCLLGIACALLFSPLVGAQPAEGRAFLLAGKPSPELILARMGDNVLFGGGYQFNSGFEIAAVGSFATVESTNIRPLERSQLSDRRHDERRFGVLGGTTRTWGLARLTLRSSALYEVDVTRQAIYEARTVSGDPQIAQSQWEHTRHQNLHIGTSAAASAPISFGSALRLSPGLGLSAAISPARVLEAQHGMERVTTYEVEVRAGAFVQLPISVRLPGGAEVTAEFIAGVYTGGVAENRPRDVQADGTFAIRIGL